MPLPDPRRFPVLAHLEQDGQTFDAECRQLSPDEFMAWPDRAAYSAGWSVFPLFLHSAPASLVVDFAVNQRRCPRSTASLRAHPRIVGAAFSRIAPGCHIYPHTDFATPNVIRSHLALDVPDRCVMRVGDDVVGWRTRRALVFDGQISHEVANLGDRARVVLLVDFLMTAAERDEVARTAALTQGRLATANSP